MDDDDEGRGLEIGIEGYCGRFDILSRSNSMSRDCLPWLIIPFDRTRVSSNSPPGPYRDPPSFLIVQVNIEGY